jgi:hypothetical protein
MALVVIIVAIVVVVAMGVTVTAVKSDTPANSAISIGNRYNQSQHFLHAARHGTNQKSI